LLDRESVRVPEVLWSWDDLVKMHIEEIYPFVVT
jgi:hypothetical protein